MSSRTAFIGVLAAILNSVGNLPAARLETATGLRVELSPRGRLTSLAIGSSVLPLKSPGGLAVADFHDQPKPVNLVPNPGFEGGGHGWHLDRWQTLDTQIAHSGRASVRLTVPPAEPRSTTLEVRVPVKPNTRYRVGLWLRREQVGVCGAYASERDDRGQLTGKRTQVGTNIPKQDGAWLPLAWEVKTEPRTTRLSLRADIYRSTGTLWLDDYFVEELTEGVYEPVEGQVTAQADGVQLNAALARRGLEVQATFRPGPLCLRVDGEIRDTTGKDRAVGLRFALPLDLAGWTWHHDAEERETIAPGAPYRLTYACRTGVRECSIYPWAAVSGPAAGLSLALPVAQGPRVFVLQHDQRCPETSLSFFFGLAPDAGQNRRRATFSLVLYPHDPAWGMRSAMQTYYRLFPESFVKRNRYEGYLNYANLERFEPAGHQLVVYSHDRLDDASDFGEGYKFLWHLHGCYDYRQVACADPQRPADDQVLALLRGMVETEKSKPKWYTPTAETIPKIVRGPEGEILYIGDTQYWRAHEGYNHTDQAGWGFNFRVNEDPGISPFLANVSRTKAQEYSRKADARPWDAMFTADAIEGYMANASGPDYCRAHFRTTLMPLSFGFDSLRPCLPNTIWDFHHKAWWPISGQYKIVTHGNANGYDQFFTMPYVDVPMTEFDWDPQHPGRLDRFMRAVAYRKIWRHWHAWNKAGRYADKDPASVEAHFRRGLACAVYPALSSVQLATGDLEPYRPRYRQYVPAIEELSAAGWDPVPYATAGEGLVVERFGTFAQGELHFTLRNYTDRPLTAPLALDRKGLGIPADAELVAIDILPRAPHVESLARQLKLDADGTLALWVGTRRQAAQHGMRLACATLEKLERTFAGELNAASRTVWRQALEKAQAGAAADPARALRLAEELQQMALRLETELPTSAPVDLAKLLFRLRADVSLVPVALLNVESRAPRLLTDAIRGETAKVPWTLVRSGLGLADARTRVVAPWAEVAKQSGVHASNGDARSLEAELCVPPKPARRLIPYLLEVRAQADGQPFTVATPIDVQVGPPLELKLTPESVSRGQQCKLRLALVNRCPKAARLTIQFRMPAKAQLEPAQLVVALGARASVDRELALTIDRNVPIGALRLNYKVTGDDGRFDCDGPLFLTVEDKPLSP